MRMRKHYPVAMLSMLLVAIALSASLVTANANATPTWTCGSCHPSSTTHPTAIHHVGIACATCHANGGTANPPTPAACASCHTIPATHPVSGGCFATGCHSVPSATATITSFAPPSGPVGTNVTINGTGFTGATAVAFNGTAAATSTVNVVSATQITATVPLGATTGTIAVTPLSGPVATSATNFTVTVPAVTTKVTLKVAPTSIRFRRTVKATGAVTPVLALVGSKVALKAQIKKGTRWVTTKSVTATVKASGAYSWTYKPAKRGTYRMQASIKATATKRASHSPWRTFKVR